MRQRDNSELFQPCMENFLFHGYSCISGTETCWNKKSSTLVLISLSEKNSFNDNDLKFVLFVLNAD